MKILDKGKLCTVKRYIKNQRTRNRKKNRIIEIRILELTSGIKYKSGGRYYQ